VIRLLVSLSFVGFDRGERLTCLKRCFRGLMRGLGNFLRRLLGRGGLRLLVFVGSEVRERLLGRV
jgi:hypothetical protein